MDPRTDPAVAGLRTKSADEVRAILGRLKRRLEGMYGDRLRALYLFGSYARAEALPGSDLDILVVLSDLQSYSREIERTSHVRAELSLEYDTTISMVYASEEDWRRGTSPFLVNARREGIAA